MDDEYEIPPTEPAGELTPPPRLPPTAVAAGTPGPGDDPHEGAERRSTTIRRAVRRAARELGGRVVREVVRRVRRPARS